MPMHPTQFFDLESYRLETWSNILSSIKNNTFKETESLIQTVFEIEVYWAYPGKETLAQLAYDCSQHKKQAIELLVKNILDSLKNQSFSTQKFIPFYTNLNNLDKPQNTIIETDSKKLKPYFEVLIIHPSIDEYELLYRNSLANFKTFQDDFLYDILFVDNYHDAIIAILSNPYIQCCVYLDKFNIKKPEQYAFENHFNTFLNGITTKNNLTIALKKHIAHLRPELDHYYMSDGIHTEQHQDEFNRIIYSHSNNLFAEMHTLILSGIEQHYSTPFFDALRSYSRRPKNSFHALPISQGQSIYPSPWIKDVADFYGNGIFSAETSSTLGGMDSIMDPKGSICQAQNKAANLFLSQHTYFITNGTTTANKIVMQANLHPGDIILVSSDCHKSIPYSILLSGATPVFLETYPLNQYDLYGCVTLRRIKQVLLDLKKQNKLHLVKQITLTNSTFDGVIYDVKRYMMDILAIKPDIIFHWDEAWFSFGYFNPLYQGKTAMSASHALNLMKNDPQYHKIYNHWKLNSNDSDEYILNNDLYPNPDQYIIRAYATHSVHKTLTAFRQASMLHVHDEKFMEDDFYEAYRTHTSTSPNYQIIASLDFARRQMSLEGYKLVKTSLQLAWSLRNKIKNSDNLNRYFNVLDDNHLIPDEFRKKQNLQNHTTMFFADVYQQHRNQLFSVDPTRITIDISASGLDGPNFRQMLMTQYDIQVNKTSHNTVLFIINIGANKNNIQYLIEALHHIANKLDNSPSLTRNKKYIADLPLTRNYHSRFIAALSSKENNFQAVKLRDAYYAGLDKNNITYTPITTELMQQADSDTPLVSAGFITPYPPGFPIIVPGQLINIGTLKYLQNIQIKEIHGYHADQGLKTFTTDFLARDSE